MSYSTIEKDLDLSSDLENWMSNLPLQLRSVPIIHLAIPGKKKPHLKSENIEI